MKERFLRLWRSHRPTIIMVALCVAGLSLALGAPHKAVQSDLFSSTKLDGYAIARFDASGRLNAARDTDPATCDAGPVVTVRSRAALRRMGQTIAPTGRLFRVEPDGDGYRLTRLLCP